MTLSKEELLNLEVAKSVDARGTSCPGPLLEAKRAMAKIKKGEILEILSSDEGTLRDLPKWCAKVKHEYLGHIEEPGFWKIYIKRMK